MTRTLHYGSPTPWEKEAYTRVLMVIRYRNYLFCVNVFDTGFHRAGESNIQAGDNRYKDGHSDQESGLRISFSDVK